MLQKHFRSLLLPLTLSLSLTLATLASAQNAAINPMEKNFVRVWEGKRQSGVTMETFTEFLTQVLFQTTITANDSLVAYIPVVLKSHKPMPRDAYLTEAPFDEAALVVHRDEASYNESRRVNPWYGPQHFQKDAGFDEQNSFSAVPQELTGSAVEFATREKRVAYDLRAKPFGNPNWQEGRTLVSVILRKKGTSDEVYAKALADYSNEVKKDLAKYIDGHFLRASEGHALEYLRFNNLSAYAWGRNLLNTLARKYSAVLDTNYFRDLALEIKHGKATAIPGVAINIKFTPVVRPAPTPPPSPSPSSSAAVACDESLGENI
jgi:hypothetical protein